MNDEMRERLLRIERKIELVAYGVMSVTALFSAALVYYFAVTDFDATPKTAALIAGVTWLVYGTVLRHQFAKL